MLGKDAATASVSHQQQADEANNKHLSTIAKCKYFLRKVRDDRLGVIAF